jgi:hypothetical protein
MSILGELEQQYEDQERAVIHSKIVAPLSGRNGSARAARVAPQRQLLTAGGQSR